MNVLQYSLERLNSCISEVDSIIHSEFPYSDSRIGLDLLKKIFEDQRNELLQYDAKSDPTVVRQSCMLSAATIVTYLPLLGFILRSTNVRNGFEVCRPLLRLSKAIIESNAVTKNSTHLILSSEWDYSPYIYSDVPALPGFVLIGFPATESANPLIVPLAGHEIGHSLWSVSQATIKYQKLIYDKLVSILTNRLVDYNALFNQKTTAVALTSDMFILETWAPAQAWALKQAEETFCDFIGVYLFGTAYLYSFAYLIAPSWGGTRAHRYPKQLTRIANMVTAANSYNVSIPRDFGSQFDEVQPPRGVRTDHFLLDISDAALAIIIPDLIQDVKIAIDSSGFVLPSSEGTQTIVDRFRKVIPAENVASLSDILNAAWLVFEDPDLWKGIPTIEENRSIVLRDLVLKTIEVLDIEQTLKEAT